MAGRRRRASDSSVATADDFHNRWDNETSVLRPLPPNDENSNDWPIFALTDAVILRKDGKSLGNPLLVDTDGPFIVRGKVESSEETLPRFRTPVKSAYIEILDSCLYSIGSPPATLWVSGAAGWFEIHPSPSYEAMHTEIREAIDLYYHTMDVCETHQTYSEEYAAAPKGKKKKMKPPEPMTLDTLLLKYAVAAGDGVYRHEAEERFHKWAQFLIFHFPKETDFNWSGTFLHDWIIKQHPNIYNRRLKIAKLPSLPGAAPRADSAPEELKSAPKSALSGRARTTTSRSRDREDVETQGAAKSDHPKSEVKGAKRETPQQSEGRESALGALLNVLEEVARDFGQNMQRIRLATMNYQLYMKCKIKDYKASPEIVAYYAKDLLYRLPPKWRESPLYADLKEVVKVPLRLEHITAEDLPRLLRHRERKEDRNAARVAHAGPPAVPASSKLALKGRPRQDLDSPSDESAGQGSTEARPARRRGRPPAGKGAVLRLATAPKKRTASETGDESSGIRARKSARLSRPLLDDEDVADDLSDDTAPSDEEAGGLDEAAVLGMLPNNNNNNNNNNKQDLPKDAVRIVVHAEKLPSMSPAGPNGTWVCDQEDCGFVVRAAGEGRGRASVEQHLCDHQMQADMMDLAVAESHRGRLPINNLISKIQEMGKKALVTEHDAFDGSVPPPAVKRRLLI